jgi:hypothetical protein
MLTSATITLESNIFEYKYPIKNDDLFIYPFYLTIKPNDILENGQVKGISSNQNISKIRKMIYDWGDGTTDTIDVFVSSDDKQKINPAYTNIIKNYNATKNDLNTKTHTINISALRFGVKNPEIYKIYLTLNKPNVFKFFGDKLELIESRMFGLDNKMLYVFEVKDNFGQLYMTSVNWENVNDDSFSLEQLNSPKRPYQFDLPFIKNKNLQNQNIEEEAIVDYVE